MLTKRVFDVIASSIGLLLLAPLLVIAALAIKCDSPGPVFFRQQRVGRYGVTFRIFKLRTMTVTTAASSQLTIGNDARVTRAGAILRRYKLDELPQLINVVRGEMSLVGPRPEVPRFVACYPVAVRDRVLSVAPGITDWASIRYKDESALLGTASDPERRYTEEVLPIKLGYYVRYVEQRTFLGDLKVLAATVVAIFR